MCQGPVVGVEVDPVCLSFCERQEHVVGISQSLDTGSLDSDPISAPSSLCRIPHEAPSSVAVFRGGAEDNSRLLHGVVVRVN